MSEQSELPDAVDRWETTGGTWRVLSVLDDIATVELLRCDGGEVVETVSLRDPAALAWAREQHPVDRADDA